MIALILITSLSIVGCGPKKEESSKAAIEVAKTMETLEEKANYLVGQAKAFYNSKQFQDSIDAAKYVLRYLDKESQAAKDLLEKAKEALAAKAQDAKKAILDLR